METTTQQALHKEVDPLHLEKAGRIMFVFDGYSLCSALAVAGNAKKSKVV